MTRIVILGGGFGGAAAAVEARDLLGPEHPVTVIDRSATGHLCGANPLVIVGRGEEATRSLHDLAGRGIEVVEAEIEEIDLAEQRVVTSAGDQAYDYLVVALGASYDWAAVPGSELAYSFYDPAGAQRLRRRLDEFSGGSIVISVAGAPIKCPPAPFEAAMVIDAALRERGIRAATALEVSIPEPAPLGVAGPEASRRLSEELELREIGLRTSVTVNAVDGHTVSYSDGTTVSADVPITVPIHRLPPVVATAGLAGDKPFVAVDRATLETGTPDVFAVGDVTVIPIGERAAVPKAGVFAAGEGRTAARVIAARILGTEPPPPYDGTGHCFLAFSTTTSAQVGGRFLAPDGPEVSLGAPDEEGMRAKQAFERAWSDFAL